VYSSQGLKAIETVLVWLLVWIVLEHEEVVQKNCIESLQCHRQTLIIIIIIIIIFFLIPLVVKIPRVKNES